MKAGRELDALIATKVMDWMVDDDGEIWHGGLYLRDLNQWRPSENIGHAWEVVEKLRSLGFLVSIRDIKNQWSVQSAMWGTTHCDESAPMAICMLALQLRRISSGYKAA